MEATKENNVVYEIEGNRCVCRQLPEEDMKITSKQPHKLLQDNDCHWYLLPLDTIEDFYIWEKWMENDQEDPYIGLDFEQFRINGPHTLKIYSWEEE